MSMPTKRDIVKATLGKLLLLWTGVSVLTSALGVASWTYHIDGLIRVLANAAYIVALPGWIVVYALGLRVMRDHPIGILIANAVAWGLWIGCGYIALKLRAKWMSHSSQVSRYSEADELVIKIPNASRRAFIGNATLGLASIGAVATPGYATLIEPWSIKVRRYTIPIKDLDPLLDGLKLVQLADTHLGPRIPASFVERAVALVINQQPDLVLLTGDHIHDGTKEIVRAAQLCQPLIAASQIGVVGVLGNHDWWGDGDRMSSALTEQGVHMIDNDRRWIDPITRRITDRQPTSGGLAIVGLGDLTDGVIDSHRAFRGVDPTMSCIVLAHNPDTAELQSLTNADSPRIDLMCSGHTHGGQVKIPLIGTPMVPSNYGSKYAGGLVNGPSFPVHISRGIGMSLLPVRVGVPPEISVITLVRG